MRRLNMDPRRRRAERRRGEGPQAAGEFLWETARSGRWFLPRDWKSPEDFWPYAHTINNQRAYWLRLLGYLKWPQAAALEGIVSTTVPPRLACDWGPGGLEWPSAIDAVGSVKPFTRIGPKVAGEIGLEVMRTMAFGAVRSVAHLDGTIEKGLDRAIEIDAELKRLLAEYRSAGARSLAEYRSATRVGPGGSIRPGEPAGARSSYEVYSKNARPLEQELWGIASVPEHPVLFGEDHHRASFSLSGHHAQTAFWHAFARRHSSDMPEAYADTIFDAVMALAFACDAEKGNGPVVHSGEWRPRSGWTDRYGLSPTSACVTIANRAVKKAMLGPALQEIATQLARWG